MLERDPVVLRVFRRSTMEIIFNFYSHWSLGSRTASCAGSFSWTAMPLRLFINREWKHRIASEIVTRSEQGPRRRLARRRCAPRVHNFGLQYPAAVQG